MIFTFMLPLMVSCGGDDDKNSNNADIAITGTCIEVGEDYARIEGYLNQRNITASYSSLQVGVEYSIDESFRESTFAQSNVIEGNRFEIEINNLRSSTYYYYRTCVKINSLKYVGKTSSFTTKEKSVDYNEPDEYTMLKGTWTGHIDTYINDRFGISGDNYRTTIYFERKYRYGGRGYEVDYNINSRFADYYYHEFMWEVLDDKIRIGYTDSWNDVYIHDYTLTENRLWGYMDYGTTRNIRFELTHDEDFDWSYWNGVLSPGT